jgi:hypothetical protein
VSFHIGQQSDRTFQLGLWRATRFLVVDGKRENPVSGGSDQR